MPNSSPLLFGNDGTVVSLTNCYLTVVSLHCLGGSGEIGSTHLLWENGENTNCYLRSRELSHDCNLILCFFHSAHIQDHFALLSTVLSNAM